MDKEYALQDPSRLESSPSPDSDLLNPASTSAEQTAENTSDEEDKYEEQTDGQYATMDQYNFWERQAVRMARRPKLYLWVAFCLSATLGILGMTLDDLNAADHTGWNSRGTAIANRHTQLLLVQKNAEELLKDTNGSVWDELIQNVQPGWEQDNSVTGGDQEYRRKLLLGLVEADEPLTGLTESESGASSLWTSLLSRRLQEQSVSNNLSSKLSQCDIDWYNDGRMLDGPRLWPVWKVKNTQTSFLNPQLLEELCGSEANTQAFLEDHDLCTGCPAPNQCLPPFSLVLYARLTVQGGIDMTCTELGEAWKEYETESQNAFQQCAIDLKHPEEDGLPDACPFGFDPSLVDESVDTTSLVHYTSSIFATTDDMVEELYRSVNDFDKGARNIQGAYDTQYQDFVTILAEDAVGTDMILATASAIITTVAILIHTRSPFLTMAGLLQICLSFPLAYFVYVYVVGLTFFPFLNFIGVFVVFALGADDVFVAADKWKNYRNEHPDATTEQVAAAALPDAAYAMLLTTSTTSVAFFGTAICPVAPIRVFAVFSGLLIFLDYIMVIVILFPCLCIYDGYRYMPRTMFSWCFSFEWWHCQGSVQEDNNGEAVAETEHDQVGAHGEANDNEDAKSDNEHGDTQEFKSEKSLHSVPGTTADAINFMEEEAVRPSLIRRMLLAYYKFIYTIRWPLLVCSMTAFVISAYYASTIDFPESTEVRVLKPSVEYEHNYAWRMQLLSTALMKKGGSKAYVIWGVKPADTGDHNNPNSWSQMVLDEAFDPSSNDAQLYLRDFGSGIFQEFAGEPEPDYACPINQFDAWLHSQSNRTDESSIWLSKCNGATGLPMDPEVFHPCMTAWAQLEEESSILSYNGKVQIMFFPFASRVRYDSTNEKLKAEWNLIDDWLTKTLSRAPKEVANAFFSSPDFWYYDTTTQMVRTAYGSIAIALAAAAIVIFVSSRSLVMTLFSVVSVAYVLMSVISMSLAVGWTLGFLESICFAIAIGISVDFVIHFSHAYTTPRGNVSREERTEFALIHMGPSILAAAFTTIAGATIMFFTTIEFFAMFATVLFFTIIQATIGSFVFFLTLTNCIGPSQPTYLADLLLSTKCGCGGSQFVG